MDNWTKGDLRSMAVYFSTNNSTNSSFFVVRLVFILVHRPGF
jgi:hypothetical protein